MHHAYVIEGEIEQGIEHALMWIKEKLGLHTHMSPDGSGAGNPDVIILRHDFFSVDDARRVQEYVMQAPLKGDRKAIIIAVSQLLHQSQNALLKTFEEPPEGTFLFFIAPNVAGLLPTFRSRVQALSKTTLVEEMSPLARDFIQAVPEKRSALAKKLSTSRSDEERRRNRTEAVAIVNGIERAAAGDIARHAALLRDIQRLRVYLNDASAPVKLVLEHLAIVTPRNLI